MWYEYSFYVLYLTFPFSTIIIPLYWVLFLLQCISQNPLTALDYPSHIHLFHSHFSLLDYHSIPLSLSFPLSLSPIYYQTFTHPKFSCKHSQYSTTRSPGYSSLLFTAKSFLFIVRSYMIYGIHVSLCSIFFIYFFVQGFCMIKL